MLIVFCKELHTRRLGSMSKIVPGERGKSTAFPSLKGLLRESEQNIDIGDVLAEIDPPFFDLEPQDYTLAVTGRMKYFC